MGPSGLCTFPLSLCPGIKCMTPKPELRPWIFSPLVLHRMQNPLSEALGFYFLQFYSPGRFLDRALSQHCRVVLQLSLNLSHPYLSWIWRCPDKT